MALFFSVTLGISYLLPSFQISKHHALNVLKDTLNWWNSGNEVQYSTRVFLRLRNGANKQRSPALFTGYNKCGGWKRAKKNKIYEMRYMLLQTCGRNIQNIP